MRKLLSRIWLPAVVITIAAAQTFGMDISRNAGGESPVSRHSVVADQSSDTVIYVNNVFTKFRKNGEKIDMGGDFTLNPIDSTDAILPRDTIKIPDSLKYTDPFRYKYYIALVDSLTHAQLRDSLIQAGDSLILPRLDSIYYADSTARAKAAFDKWYSSLDKSEKKKYDFEQKMKARQHMMDSLLTVKDEEKAIKDSIREYTPRILETFAVADSMQYKRIISWTRDPLFSKVQLHDVDTSYNTYFNDYPFMRKDINVTYLGISGSAVQTYDFFKRTNDEGVSFYQPYQVYSFTPSTLPMYNTKTPYTELAYWGTLFADKQNEESDIHLMTTQNITPEFNFMLQYDRNGANGLLENERVDNRTFVAAANYMGKRYLAHGGYIYNKVDRKENGGIIDNFWIKDTVVGPREIAVNLTNAGNLMKKNTLFLDQTYRIPFNFIKTKGERQAIRTDKAYRDSVLATGDSLMIAVMEEELAKRKENRRLAARDTLNKDITTAFIGHSSEYSVYRKVYSDNITSAAERNYYDNYYLNPKTSHDSLRVMRLENKVFLKLQPWASDAILSSLDVGLGNRILNYYMFNPRSYITKPKNTVWNSTWIYAGIGGSYSKYFNWDAEGYYTFLGQEINDVGLKANAELSLYPFRRDRKSPINFNARFETSLDEPEYFEQHYFSNHFRWDNNFNKKSVTKIEGSVDIPRWRLRLEAGYSLLDKNIYYDTLGVIRQNTTPMSVFKAAISKDFTLWKFHFDNRALFQHSSNEDVMPLPTLALNLKWYLELGINKPGTAMKAMNMQIGVNTTYTTKWYAPSYNPAVGQFHNQNTEKYGDCPYFDVFVNIRWKRACIFVKYLNAGMGWPNDSADYFSAAGYIRPQRAFKFGIYWPFYVQPHKAKTMSGNASSSGSGGRSGSSSGGGLGGMLGRGGSGSGFSQSSNY